MLEHPTTSGDEITFRQLAFKLRDFFHEILRLWYIPAICALLGGGYLAYKYFRFVPQYSATITFNVDEDEGGGNSGLNGILGQFGLGNVRPVRYNLDKILALGKSRRVIQETLFAKISVNGKEDYIANHLIREYDLGNSSSAGGIKKHNFLFTHDSLTTFTIEENDMLIGLYNFIIGSSKNPKSGLMNADYNEDTNIMSLTVHTTNEALSIELAHRLFEALSKYYINKSIEKLLKTYNLVNAKKDSVLAVLKSAEYALASFRDTHRMLLMRTDMINELRLQRDIAALTAMYAEVIKNVEVADFSLKTKTPFIQMIDAPLSPIYPSELSFIRQVIKGMFLGGILGCFLVIGRKLFQSIFSTSRVSYA